MLPIGRAQSGVFHPLYVEREIAQDHMNSWTAVNIPAGWSEVWKGRMENWGQGFLEK